jgi:hypothetical protein
MKVHIYKDEWYPVYSMITDDPWNSEYVDLPEDKYKEWDRVFKEFQRIQYEIKQLLKDA